MTSLPTSLSNSSPAAPPTASGGDGGGLDAILSVNLTWKITEVLERGYWRDVGNIDSYFQANMDLLAYDPELNLYSNEWPLRTFNYNFPPAKFIWDEDKRLGVAKNSLVSEGCIISGGSLSNCVLSPKVHINSYCHISHSILLENVKCLLIPNNCKCIKACSLDDHTRNSFCLVN